MEKGVKKCAEIDFFGAVWYNKVELGRGVAFYAISQLLR